MTKMNPGVKAKWLAALRSGEYKQGHGALRSLTGQFCCLGVLCDIAAKDGVVEWVKGRGIADDMLDPDEHPYGETGVLPDLVKQWAGLRDSNPAAGAPARPLATHNDRGLSFTAIADLIEAHL